MPKTNTRDNLDPCQDCKLSKDNGLECDNCKKWFCDSCINTVHPGSLPQELYDFLSQIGTFNWECHNCGSDSLPKQLLSPRKGNEPVVTNRQQLIDLGVNLRYLYVPSTPAAGGEKGQLLASQIKSETSESSGAMGPDVTVATTTAEATSPIPGPTLSTAVVPTAASSTAGGGVAELVDAMHSMQTMFQQSLAVMVKSQQEFLAMMQKNQGTDSSATAITSVGLVPPPHAQMTLGTQQQPMSSSVGSGPLQSASATVSTPAFPPALTSGHDAPLISLSAPAALASTMPSFTGTVTTCMGQPFPTQPYSSAHNSFCFQPIMNTSYSGSRVSVGGYGTTPIITSAEYVPAPVPVAVGGATATAALPPLPTIPLAEFSGDLESFQDWWESFECNIHARNLPDRIKFDFLKKVLKGSAARKVAGLNSSGANYADAIKILHSTYGRPDLLRTQLWTALDELEPVRPNLKNLEHFVDTIRVKSSALKRLGVSSDTLNEYSLLLHRKLPGHLQQELQKTQHLLQQLLLPGVAHQRQTLDSFLETLIQYQVLPGKETQPNQPREQRGGHSSDPSGAERQGSAVHLIQSSQSNQDSGRYQRGTFQNKSAPQRPPNAKFLCIFCDGQHYTHTCKNVLDLKERRRIAQSKKVCFKCLGKSHMAPECRSPKFCYLCGNPRHHSSLCPNIENSEPGASSHSAKATTKSSDKLVTQTEKKAEKGVKTAECCATQQVAPLEESVITAATATTTTTTTQMFTENEAQTVVPKIMAILPADLQNPITKQRIRVKTFLDGGAQNTTISEDVAKALDLVPMKELLMSTARFRESDYVDIKATQVHFTFCGLTGFHIPMGALSIKSPCPELVNEPVKLSPEDQKFLDKLHVVNKPPLTCENVHIDLIIGQDYYNSILFGPTSKIYTLQGSLCVFQTPFGAIMSGCPGPVAEPSLKRKRLFNNALMCMINEDLKSVHTQESVGESYIVDLQSSFTRGVENIWNLDSIGIKQQEAQQSQEEQLKETFCQLVSTEEDGRIQVRWPYKMEHPQIDSNRHVASRRLLYMLQGKLCPKGEITDIFRKYNDIFVQYLKDGIIEKVEETMVPQGKVLHYLSHFPVIRETSSTTKVRIVLDPSSKTKSGVTLNDLIFTGINLMEDMVGLLLRMRTSKYCVLSDLEHAFLMVALHPKDRDSVRFLWLNNSTKPFISNNLQIYRYRRIPFGVVASPFLIHVAIYYHMHQRNDATANKLRGQFYMDNCIHPVNTVQECFELYTELKQFFSEIKMNLRSFISNCPEFNASLPAEDAAEGSVTKTLGLLWNTELDQLSLQHPGEFSSNSVVTKRHILHCIAKVFDPLGMSSPVTIAGQILIQKLWKESFGWDTPVSSEILKTWNKLIPDLQSVHYFCLPRQVCNGDYPVQLLCFTDASPLAFCSVIYVKQEEKHNFLFAKTKVAPISQKKGSKALTLPQLELMGILAGVRALQFVKTQLKLAVNSIHLWSDSQIALYQIKAQTAKQGIWVRNRIQEIQSHSDIDFRYIPGRENPADYGTRGVTLDQLINSLWFSGPEWLDDTCDKWPTWPLPATAEETLKQLDQPSLPNAPAIVQTQKPKSFTLVSPFNMKAENFSTIDKLLRVTSYSNRCVNRLKGNRPSKQSRQHISINEINTARKMWIQHLQRMVYADTISNLKKKKSNQLIKQLDLFLDPDDGLLRCGGRLANAPIGYEAKYPILLPKGSYLTKLFILEAHKRCFHFKPGWVRPGWVRQCGQPRRTRRHRLGWVRHLLYADNRVEHGVTDPGG